MATTTNTPLDQLGRHSAIRVWRWLSPGVNHPDICRPSKPLLEYMLGEHHGNVNNASDAIWNIARTSLRLPYPGLDRPLGSCYHPGVAATLDVAWCYGDQTRAVLRRLNKAAARVTVARRAEIESGRVDDYVIPRPRHIDVTGQLVRLLSVAIWDAEDGPPHSQYMKEFADQVTPELYW